MSLANMFVRPRRCFLPHNEIHCILSSAATTTDVFKMFDNPCESGFNPSQCRDILLNFVFASLESASIGAESGLRSHRHGTRPRIIAPLELSYTSHSGFCRVFLLRTHGILTMPLLPDINPVKIAQTALDAMRSSESNESDTTSQDNKIPGVGGAQTMRSSDQE
jgi:hypothetical protein